MLVGVARVDRFGGLRNAQMFQLAFATGQASTDLAQRVRPRELTEQHGHELAPTGEAASVPPGPMPPHSLLELDAREQLRKLSKVLQKLCMRLRGTVGMAFSEAPKPNRSSIFDPGVLTK